MLTLVLHYLCFIGYVALSSLSFKGAGSFIPAIVMLLIVRPVLACLYNIRNKQNDYELYMYALLLGVVWFAIQLKAHNVKHYIIKTIGLYVVGFIVTLLICSVV